MHKCIANLWREFRVLKIRHFINVQHSFPASPSSPVPLPVIHSSEQWAYRILIQVIMGKTKAKFYAVARGRQPGVFLNWPECEAQVKGFPNARFKSFETQVEAQDFVKEHQALGVTRPVAVAQSVSVSSSSTNAGGVKTGGLSEALKGTFRKPCSTRKFAGSTVPPVPVLTAPEKQSSAVSLGQQKMNFSTSKVLQKRKMKVTEERIINKRLKTTETSNAGVDLKQYEVDEAGYIVVYTDGACSQNGKKGSKAGVGVWFGDNHKLNVSEAVHGRQTNNTAEIQAAEKAIQQAKINGIDKLNVKTDSQFLINCITQWIHKWKRNGWKLSNGNAVANREDLEKLDSVMADMDIKWSYVPGHKGHRGNEAADRLAVEGASQ